MVVKDLTTKKKNLALSKKDLICKDLTACMICRGIEETIPELIRSLPKAGVDFLNVTLTQQKSRKFIEDTCKEVKLPYSITEFDWIDDTGACRQFNLEQLPKEAKWMIWVDSDDTIEGDLKTILKQAEEKEVEICWLWYQYSFDEWGNPTNLFMRERIVRTRVLPLLHWEGIIHEVLIGCEKTKNDNFEGAFIKHHHKEEDRASRNEPQLLKALEETDNVRFKMYMGHHKATVGKPMEAIRWYEDFANDARSSPPEKWQALCYAAGSCRAVQDFVRAIPFCLQAIEIAPSWIDSYIELCINYYYMGDIEKSLYWANEANTKVKPSNLLFFNPMFVTKDLQMHKSLALAQQGKYDEAHKIMVQIAKLLPEDGTIQEMERKVRECVIRSRTIDGIKALSLNLLQHCEIEKLAKVKDILPWWLPELGDEYKVITEGIDRHTILLNPEMNKKFYDAVPVSNGVWCDEKCYRYEWTVNQVKKLKAKSVIDIGAGQGIQLKLIQKAIKGVEVFAVEPNHLNCETMAKNGIKYFYEGSFEDYKATKHFDVAILSEYLEHVIDPQKHLNKAFSIADKVIITVPRPSRGDMRPPKDKTANDHLRVVTIENLETWMTSEKGRRFEHLEVFFGAGADFDYTAAVFSHRPWHRKKIYKFLEMASPEMWCPHANVAGGSELALREVSKRLDAKGNVVFVYYHGAKRVYDGVVYRPYDSYNPEYGADVLISSRTPAVFKGKVTANMKYLWAHDIHYGDAYTQDIENSIQGVLLSSEFHKTKWLEQYPWSKKIHIVGGGIDASLFKPTKPKKPNSFIWASAPTRGLLELLQGWAIIKKSLPDAVLDIYYGWDWFDKWGGANVYPNLKSQIMTLCEQDGVTWHGKVSHEEIAKALQTTDIWLYPPNDFEETYCAFAVEAMASGVRCFYRPNGALPETIGDRGIKVTNSDPEDWVAQIVINHRKFMSYTLKANRLWALKQDWSLTTNKICSIVKADEEVIIRKTSSEESG